MIPCTQEECKYLYQLQQLEIISLEIVLKCPDNEMLILDLRMYYRRLILKEAKLAICWQAFAAEPVNEHPDCAHRLVSLLLRTHRLERLKCIDVVHWRV